MKIVKITKARNIAKKADVSINPSDIVIGNVKDIDKFYEYEETDLSSRSAWNGVIYENGVNFIKSARVKIELQYSVAAIRKEQKWTGESQFKISIFGSESAKAAIRNFLEKKLSNLNITAAYDDFLVIARPKMNGMTLSEFKRKCDEFQRLAIDIYKMIRKNKDEIIRLIQEASM